MFYKVGDKVNVSKDKLSGSYNMNAEFESMYGPGPYTVTEVNEVPPESRDGAGDQWVRICGVMLSELWLESENG